MAAISAAAEASNTQSTNKDRAQRSLPKGTIGSIRAGLGGIQDIDTALILPWGPPDRLDPELTAVNSDKMPESIEDLADSISNAGQQVPVLLRPSKDRDGHFEVVYGRRRILACKRLGIPVKSLIRTLDDTEALMAKGLENSSRADLSFYERARFATAIIDQGYDRATACQALSVSKNTLSQLERITRLIPDTVGDAIGSAPESGRPKWTLLSSAIEESQANEAACLKLLEQCPADMASDDRLTHLIKAISKPNEKVKPSSPRQPVDGVQIKSGNSSIAMSVKRGGKHAAFADWLDKNIDSWIEESFERFQAQQKQSKNPE